MNGLTTIGLVKMVTEHFRLKVLEVTEERQLLQARNYPVLFQREKAHVADQLARIKFIECMARQAGEMVMADTLAEEYEWTRKVEVN